MSRRNDAASKSELTAAPDVEHRGGRLRRQIAAVPSALSTRWCSKSLCTVSSAVKNGAPGGGVERLGVRDLDEQRRFLEVGFDVD